MLRFLGSTEYQIDGQITPLKASKPLMILAYLASSADWVSRDHIAGLIWPETNAGTRLTRFRQMLQQLRDLGLSPDLEVERLRVRWSQGSDLHQLHQAYANEDWLEVVRLSRGPLLSGLALEDDNPYSDWLLHEREQLRAKWLSAASKAATVLEQQGRLNEAVDLWERVLQEDGLAEAALCELLRVCLLSSQPARGIAAYSRFQQRLWSEYKLEPQQATLHWLEQLREKAGQNEQRPLASPEVITDIASESADSSASGTPFIGREREIGALLEWLSHDAGDRIVTLYGPGGIGKTRLALEVLRKSPRYGVLVPLLSVHPGQSVGAAVAQALGKPLRGIQTAEQELREQLEGRLVLLVLDNAEHLQAEMRAFLGMLADLPQVKFLITSRARLGYPDEHGIEIDGLELDKADAQQAPAMRLLFHAVRKARPGFIWTAYEAELGQQICRAVGGAPLALELAGSWTRLFTLAEIAQKIEQGLDFLEGSLPDLPQRHRGLRMVFEQSWRLLSEAERMALCRLSVFEGGFEVSAGLEVAQIAHRDLLALTDKALLRVMGENHRRCDVHPLILEYAREQLQGSAKTGVLQRHAQFFLEFAEENAPKLRGAEQIDWLERMHLEHPNLRLALDWLIAQKEASGALRLAAALHWFWYVRGHHREGLQQLERALALTALQATAEYAEAMRCAGALASDLGEYAKSRRWLEQALTLWQQVEDKAGIARTWHNLGLLCRSEGNLDESAHYLQQSIEANRDLGNIDGLATSLNDLAITVADKNDIKQARPLFEESLSLKEVVGDQMGIAYGYNNLAVISFHEGRPFEETRPLYEKSLEIKRQLGDQHGVGTTLHNLGQIAKQDNPVAARKYLLEAINLFYRLGNRLRTAHSLAVFAQVVYAEGQLEKTATLIGFIQKSSQQAGFKLNDMLLQTLQTIQQEIADALGKERSALAHASGQALNLEQIIKLAQS